MQHIRHRVIPTLLALALAAALAAAPNALAANVQRSVQKLTVNGTEIACDKYNIDGRNYFKLRDLAQALNGTQAQFQVSWDDAAGIVAITGGQPYTPDGSELVIGDDLSASATPSAQTIMINGEVRSDLSVYNIGGNNYFQLRELGTALGFAVDYIAATNSAAVTSPAQGAARPVTLFLKYNGGGNTDPWSVEEKATTASPCADVDGDGKEEIIFFVRTVFCLDAETGAIKWSTPAGHDVSEGSGANVGTATYYVPTQIVDLDGDGALEIVVFATDYGAGKTSICVYDGFGYLKTTIETAYVVRGATIADLNGDGRMEIAVGLGVGDAFERGAQAICLYDCSGNLLWSRPCGYGLYSNSIEAVDLDDDGSMELVMLNDQPFILALHADGSEVVINSGVYSGRAWSNIYLFESYQFSQDCIIGQSQLGSTRETTWTIMGTKSGITVADVDNDGTAELVCTSMINDQTMNDDAMSTGYLESFDGIAKYFAPFILNLNHSRYVNASKGFDWTAWPKDVAPIFALDDPELFNPDLNPAVTDLDGDSFCEIIYSSNDGYVHCFSLDGKEHGAWPFNLNAGSGVKTFASKPVTGDVNGDGRPEVIFTTYTASNQTEVRGKLFVLDAGGKVLAEETLPEAWFRGGGGDADKGYANGCMAEPVLADVDRDGSKEIVLTTISCGVCVYDVG